MVTLEGFVHKIQGILSRECTVDRLKYFIYFGLIVNILIH